jgi:hypothetical protein
MKKQALGLNDIAIPGVPYANREGMQDDDLAVSNRFFGKEDADNKNQNSQPIIKKRFETPEDAAYQEDPAATKYFEYLLKMRAKKKSRRKEASP